MQTAIVQPLIHTPAGKEAESILRSCVHCGFCTATCPTYQVTGDELDGPRGRIYLIKSLLEGNEISAKTQCHLDRCLGCRACESTCPSGVRYSRLLEIGRAELGRKVPRPLLERAKRRVLRAIIPHPKRLGGLLRAGQVVRAFLPGSLAAKIPEKREPGQSTPAQHSRTMLLLESCGQPSASPRTNAAAIRVLDRLGIRLERVAQAGCCGALSHHLEATEEARRMARRNIDAWWPALAHGAEAVVVTASGCGTALKEYGELLADDADYRERAQRIAAMSRDISEVVAEELVGRLSPPNEQTKRVAFHSPCSLQHAQKRVGQVEELLSRLGFVLTAVPDSHLCCGSAGPYSLLQPDMSSRLRRRKLDALGSEEPDIIATANIGCQLHLQSGTTRPVCHWIELVDEALCSTTL
jgi:glycolate oxidase iron-sulfur subunit